MEAIFNLVENARERKNKAVPGVLCHNPEKTLRIIDNSRAPGHSYA
jgi:hypothetical protein